jgi:hypothetical protein
MEVLLQKKLIYDSVIGQRRDRRKPKVSRSRHIVSEMTAGKPKVSVRQKKHHRRHDTLAESPISQVFKQLLTHTRPVFEATARRVFRAP